MTQVYYEPSSGGHRAAYLSAFLRHAPVDWIVACPGVLLEQIDPDLRVRLAPDGQLRHVDIAPQQDSGLRATLRSWRQSHFIARSFGTNRIFFPELDLFIKYSPFLPSSDDEIGGIFFRPIFHYSGLNFRERVIAAGQLLALRRFMRGGAMRKIFTLDRAFCSWAGKHATMQDRVFFLPDLAPDIDLASPQVQSTSGVFGTPSRMNFLLFGALQRRKGIFELIEAIAALPPTVAARAAFGIYGRLYPDSDGFSERVADVASKSLAEIRFEDRYLSDHEIIRAINGTDVILAPYVRHRGSSGLLYWAAAAGKPVITQAFGQVGYEASRYGLGETLAEITPDILANSISGAIENGKVFSDRQGQADYIDGHTSADFYTAIEHLFG